MAFYSSPQKFFASITPSINNYFIRDHETEKLTSYSKVPNDTYANFNSSNPLQSECICNNLLEEVFYLIN